MTHTIKVTFDHGDYCLTEINGTKEEVGEYYLGKSFNFGDTDAKPYDDMHKAVRVEFLVSTP